MKKNFKVRFIGGLLAISGLIMIGSVVTPLVSYEIKSRRDFQAYLSPVPEAEMRDYTKASNWFAGSADTSQTSSVVKFYNMTIPKLGIKNAVVSVGGEDLSDSLIQYPGTALPGKLGNAVVFGHSVLPSFYDPRDYLTIFSTLPTIRKQDEIKIEYDGVSYVYRVQEMFEVDPTDLDVLSQNTGSSYVTLVTCVPPGDPRRPRRLIVRAKLVPPEERSLGYAL